jgi:hypothetical protein
MHNGFNTFVLLSLKPRPPRSSAPHKMLKEESSDIRALCTKPVHGLWFERNPGAARNL